MQDLIRKLLVELGENPGREGLVDTPKRVEKALKFLTSGYQADIDAVLNNALFAVDYSEMVIVKDIDFYSLCEHHLLPFFGKCHIAYIPSARVIGLSKIPRLVDVFSRRLQVQERLTNQIADVLRDKIAPLGVAVVMEATHLCMSMLGSRETEFLRGDERHARRFPR
jgi:GTP cyclohydrolase I